MKTLALTMTILLFILCACNAPAPTPQVIYIPATLPPLPTAVVQIVTATPPPPTQTPYVLVVTATALPPTQTPFIQVVTATPEMATPTALIVYVTATPPPATETPLPSPTPFVTDTTTRAIPTGTRVPPTPASSAVNGPCPNPPHSVYWSDDFSNPSGGWMNFEGADYSHFYKDGEWHFAVSAKNETGTAWIQLRERTLHQAILVRAWKLSEPVLNSYGIVFGGQDDENYYAFRISDSGSYRLSHVIQGEWHDLIPWTKTDAIHQGGVNDLAVLLDDAQIYACANGQLVGVTGDTALQPGRVGMIAGAYDEPTHIHFDDFAVWNLQ